MNEVKIYVDGGCIVESGFGGWAACVSAENKFYEISGNATNTTNNAMELTAVIKGLRLFDAHFSAKDYLIQIYSDSKYVIDAFNKNWITKWCQNNWKTSTGTEVSNLELWKQLLKVLLIAKDWNNRFQFNWIKGHNGDPINERCDKLVKEELQKLKEQNIKQYNNWEDLNLEDI